MIYLKIRLSFFSVYWPSNILQMLHSRQLSVQLPNFRQFPRHWRASPTHESLSPAG